MNPLAALVTALRRTFDFRGRSRRAEHWWFYAWILPLFVVSAVEQSPWAELGVLLSVAAFLPYLAVSVRRLHDIDRSGWWLLIALVPIAGGLLLTVWACYDGTPRANRFGPAPKTEGEQAQYTRQAVPPRPRRQVFVDEHGNVTERSLDQRS